MVRCTTFVLIMLLAASPVVRAEETAAANVTSIRASIEKIRFDDLSPQPRAIASQTRFQQQHKPMSTATKISVGFIGGCLGFFGGAIAGGLVGAAVTPSHAVDDPGTGAGVGVLIGAPVGAVLGAIGMIRLAEQ